MFFEVVGSFIKRVKYWWIYSDILAHEGQAAIIPEHCKAR